MNADDPFANATYRQARTLEVRFSRATAVLAVIEATLTLGGPVALLAGFRPSWLQVVGWLLLVVVLGVLGALTFGVMLMAQKRRLQLAAEKLPQPRLPIHPRKAEQ